MFTLLSVLFHCDIVAGLCPFLKIYHSTGVKKKLNHWLRVLGSVVVKLYVEECTLLKPTVHQPDYQRFFSSFHFVLVFLLKIGMSSNRPMNGNHVTTIQWLVVTS